MSFSERYASWHGAGDPPLSPMYTDSAQPVAEPSKRVPVERANVTDVLIRIQMTLEDLLATQRHMLAALGQSSDSRSSVEVKTSTRGVDIASKAYSDSSMDGLSELAVDRYFATLEDVQRRLTAEHRP